MIVPLVLFHYNQKRPMQRKRKLSTLIIGILFFLLLIVFIFFVSPETYIANIAFYCMLIVSVGYIGTFITNRVHEAFILSFTLAALLWIRSLGYRHWIYSVIIIALVLAIEFMVHRKFRSPKNHTETAS